MTIMAIIGSLRDGNTKYMVDSIVDELSKSDVTIDKIHLKDITMGFCNGCLQCDTTGSCILNDDMSRLVENAKMADGFIFASPARWGLLSGEMKTFFDRLNPLAVKEELSGKKCVNIIIGQSEETEGESIALAGESIKYFCENAGIDVVDTLLAYGCYGRHDLKKAPEYIEEGIRLGFALVEQLKKS